MKYKIFRTLSIAIVLSLLMIAVIPATPALAARVIELDPEEGGIGDTITITGSGFTASTDTSERYVDIYFAENEADTSDDIDDEVDTYERLKSPQIGYVDDPDEGEFETTFKVPVELNDGTDDEDVESGTYYVYVTLFNTYRIKAYAEFTVIGGGEITIDPTEGVVGTEVEISGTDFGRREDIFIEYDGDDIEIESGDEQTDSDGEFGDTIIIIPESSAGDHTITVFGEDSGAEVEATFTVEPEITISPESGGIGAAVAVNGTGFGKRSDITIFLNDDKVATTTTDRYGSFDTTFNVPVTEPDTYDVEVWDEDDNEDTAEFTVAIATDVSISPTTGNIGTELTVNGTGFIAGGIITIKYDTTQIATTTADANGAFSATFTAPKGEHGDYNITVSDGTTTKQLTFTMESEAPPVPKPLLPEMGVKAEQPVHFDWEDVTDPSGVTYTLQIASDKGFASIVLEKKDLTDSEYTITEAEKLEPVSKEAAYYWRVKAIDGAFNESEWTGAGSFYISVSLAMPDWVKYALFGIGALLFGLLGFWIGRRTAYYSY